MRKQILSVLAALSLVPLTLAISHSACAADKDKGPTLSRKVNDALAAADKAITQNKFDVAEAKIKEAEAVEKQTDFDKFQVNEYRAYLYSKQENRTNDQIALYEQSLKTPDLFKDRLTYQQRIRALVAMSFKAKLYDKTIEFAKRSLEEQPDDKVMLGLLGQVQYQEKQYPDSRKTLEKVIALTETAGEKPEEVWLRMVQVSADEQGDKAAVEAMYEKLIRNYPKDQYWLRLIDYNEQVGRNDAAQLNFYRLRADLNLLANTDYLEYSELALDSALPGEALKIAQAGFDKKLLGADAKSKSRDDSLLAKAKQGAAADKAQIPVYEKDAAKATTTGRADAGLGLAYFSFDMNDQAIESLKKGLEKGGLKDADNYRMTLGIALFRKGDRQGARTQFEAVAANNSPQVRAAKLWALRTQI